MAIEGVLGRYPGEGRYVSMAPIQAGVSLFRALTQVGSVVLLSSFEDTDKIHHWLKLNMIHEHDYEKLVPRTMLQLDMDEPTLRQQQIGLIRYYGFPISLLVDSSSEVVAEAFRMGIVSLLFAHPSYMRPEHRPDVGNEPRTWDSIEADAIRQRELMAADTRRGHEDA
jgi:hypothetical protein